MLTECNAPISILLLLILIPCALRAKQHAPLSESFGIMAPYLYARQTLIGDDSDWAKQLYQDYLAITCTEDKTRSSQFDRALASVKNNVANSLSALHDAAINILCTDWQQIHNPATNQPARLFYGKLSPDQLDAMAVAYTELHPNSYVVTIFPVASIHYHTIRSVLSEYVSIVYEKQLHIMRSGAVNFVRTLYGYEPWLGSWHNNFANAQEKAHLCFPSFIHTDCCYAILCTAPALETILHAKKAVRSLLPASTNALHINDSHDDAVRIAHMAFNRNSLHFVNHAQAAYMATFEQNFAQLKKVLSPGDQIAAHACIDDSAVLSCYGLRDCKTLSILVHHSPHYSLPTLPDTCRIRRTSNYQAPLLIDTLIFDPAYHFYYQGIKFASLDAVQKIKELRNQNKDRGDIALIEQLSR